MNINNSGISKDIYPTAWHDAALPGGMPVVELYRGSPKRQFVIKL
jgi:hypothetical protein